MYCVFDVDNFDVSVLVASESHPPVLGRKSLVNCLPHVLDKLVAFV